MIQLKENRTYQRESDGKFFKVENKKYFIANDKGVWNETTSISLEDNFVERPVNFKKSLKQLFSEYKTGEVNVSKKAFDQLIQRLCELGDKLEQDS